MIAFIVVIEAVLALMGLMALCRLTRYRARPLSPDDPRDRSRVMEPPSCGGAGTHGAGHRRPRGHQLWWSGRPSA